MPARALGRAEAVIDLRIPDSRRMLAKIDVPDASNWHADVHEVPMLGNDRLGDCVPASVLHVIQQRRAYALRPIDFSEDDAVRTYTQFAGYDPTNATVPNPTDRGTVMSSAMASWASAGIALPDGTTDRLTAYASVQVGSVVALQRAIAMCGSVLVGINCPAKWLRSDYLFDLEPGELINSVGGHCVALMGYLPTALGLEFDVVTWGGKFRMTWRAAAQVLDEAYAPLDPDWLNAAGLDPANVAWADASAAMQQIAVA